MDPKASAMLVSDPIQCQEGDAYLSFRYWTSPRTSIRVCIRNTTTIKHFDWCSVEITKGDPGPAEVLIPGSIMYDFEIVIEARNFSYDAFGFQGGVVIIDDIKYNATTIYNCRNIPHIDSPIPISSKTCSLLNCEFEEEESDCSNQLIGSNWRRSTITTGNIHTGIRTLKNGAFIYAKGGDAESNSEIKEGGSKKSDEETDNESKEEEENNEKLNDKFSELNTTSQKEIDDLTSQLFFESQDAIQNSLNKKIARLHFEDFELPRQLILQFCVYMTSEGSKFVIESELRGYCRSRLVEFGQITQFHQWQCYNLVLQAGHYKALDFIALEMPTNYSYIGLDGFKLLEIDGQKCACPDQCSIMETGANLLNSTNEGCQQSTNSSQNPSTSPITPGVNDDFNDLFAKNLSTMFSKNDMKFQDSITKPKDFIISMNIQPFENQIGLIPENPNDSKLQSISQLDTSIHDSTLSNEIFNVDEMSNRVEEDNQLPASFSIQKDNSYTPLAIPLPSISETYVKFGGLDDDLNSLDFDAEIMKLSGNSRRRVAKF